MIEMIKPTAHGYIVYESYKVYPITSDRMFMKDLCHNYLINYQGRKEAIQNLLNKQRNIPLYINQHYSWVILKNNNASLRTWVNVIEILSLETVNHTLRVTFKSGRVEVINDLNHRFEKRVLKAVQITEKILEYCESL